jgi:hypothetical protein
MEAEPAPTEPLPFRVLIDEAMKLTRRYFRVMYLPVALPLAVVTGVLILAQSYWMEEFTSGIAAGTFSTRSCVVFLVSIAVSMAIYGLTSAVLTAAATDGAANRPIDMKAKWSFVLSPSVIGTLLIKFLAVLAGLICLFVPAIFVSIGLSFVMPIMAAERLRGTAALGRSWNLVFYRPGGGSSLNTGFKIFLLYLIVALISYAVGFLIQLPFTVMNGLKVARSVSQGVTVNASDLYASMRWTQLISSVLSSFVSTAVGMYGAFGIALLYYDVVRRKEGSDLAVALDARFGSMLPPSPPPGPTA